jgi:hypothetical protein
MENLLEIEKVGYPYLFRYRLDNEYTIDEIKNNYIFFANSKKFKDPFDCSLKLINLDNGKENNEKSINYLKSKIVDDNHKNIFNKKFKDNKDIIGYAQNKMGEYINEIGIACFTITPINIMMWANYANNHQGICIQYNVDNDNDYFKYLKNINYVDDLEQLNYCIGDSEENIFEVLNTKHKLWEKEYEKRLMKTPSGGHTLNPNAIRSIIFGLKTNEEYKKIIISTVMIHNSHIKIYKSSLMKNGFGLTLIEIIK